MTETIDAEELKKKMEKGEDFTLINVLTKESYEKEHIPGSINIPYQEIVKHYRELDKEKEIIVHCSDEFCDASSIAYEKLKGLGFDKIIDFEGGMEEWKEKGYSVEKGG
ncbi:MAG: rhodanese-like domain-containing protein [Thermoplasmatota archaeon]